MSAYSSFDFMFGIIPILVFVFFVVFIGIIVYSLAKSIQTKVKNDNSPRLSVPATIATKRTNVSHHSSGMNDHMMDSTSTSYYVTFEVNSGDRMEFSVKGREFGLLAEGDVGMLSFQGTRYLGFQR